MTLWPMVHAERAALGLDLDALETKAWTGPTLCGRWSVEEVVAHLTAAASTGRLRWLASMVVARFDAARHNQRRLAEHRGPGPAGTLAGFHRIVTSTTAASGHTPAWLGEVIVHAQDIRRPLGIDRAPDIAAATEVARFYASRDFAVPSRTAGTGLRLEATDGPFTTGAGPLVSGPTLALVMALAGRTVYCDDLDGDGVALLRSRGTAG